MMYDTIVIGGGPAGLSAALYAARAGCNVLIIEKECVGGNIINSTKVENYPGFAEISGADLINRMEVQVLNTGANIVYEEVFKVIPEYFLDMVSIRQFTVVTDLNVYTASTVIIATGTHHKSLGLPAETKYVGNGISYCAICDGALYTDKEVAVIGGGNTAIHDAILLAQQCKTVHLIHRRDTFRADKVQVDQLDNYPNITKHMGYNVFNIVPDESRLSIVLQNNNGIKVNPGRNDATITVDGVFVAVGQVPNTEIFREMIATTDDGYFVVSDDTRTKIEGIYVAGDCRYKSLRQVATAIADGATAGMAAYDRAKNFFHLRKS